MFPRLHVGRRANDRVSFALFIVLHLAVLLVFAYPMTWKLAALALGGYLLRMFAVTAGFHRYFSHRSYKTTRVFQFVLASVGTMALQNGPLWWASWHRRHHKHADTPSDPHSPQFGGFWHAHIGWVFEGAEEENRDYSNIADLHVYPELRWLDAHKWAPLLVYAAVCFLIAGPAGIVWGFVVSTVALVHATMLINSLAHVWGSRRYATQDTSRNNALLAVVTLGEGWHNNHHHYMSSTRQGFRWWEIDMTYYVLKLLAWLRIVWDLRAPPAAIEIDRGAQGRIATLRTPSRWFEKRS